jgi:hypothetical protein
MSMLRLKICPIYRTRCAVNRLREGRITKRTLVFLFLVTGTTNAIARDGLAHVTDYKQTGKNVYGLVYRIHTPHTTLHNVWLRIDLKTALFGYMNKRIADPENAVCRLKLNQEDKPAANYAQYLGGSLYFYFDKLEELSVVEFSIGWHNPDDAEGPVPEFAALEIKSDEWDKTADWRPNPPNVFPIVKDAQITIRQGIACDLF